MIEALKRELDCPADQMILYTEEPMSRHTSFRIGGPAEVYACPNQEQLPALLEAAKKRIESCSQKSHNQKSERRHFKSSKLLWEYRAELYNKCIKIYNFFIFVP